ncbi:MAG: ferredoxin-type protein NapF [Psychromonas sp.]
MKFDNSKRRLFKNNDQVTINHLLPWIQNVDLFLKNCTQCDQCISACPEKIIVKGDGGYPNIDFTVGECSFCGQCADICQEQIFISIKQSPWLKKAQIDESCLAYKNVYCRSCSESCEAQALTFQIGLSAVPEINLDLCTGCGACVAPCPTASVLIKELE